jgi:accessory colonization factor AcfC
MAFVVCCNVGVLGSARAGAQEDVRLYGPLGTNMAIEEAAVIYAARNNVKLDVVSGPADAWREQAVEDGDLVFCTGESIMSDFVRDGVLTVDKTSVTPLYVRPSAILVRPGNPKDIRDFPDLLRPGIDVMMVNGSGQTGLWENITGKLQSLQNLVALEKNIALCATSDEQAVQAWKERPDIDAWVTWNVWHMPRRDLAEVVSMSEDYRIYRKCSISLTERGRSNSVAAGFVDYLASAEGAQVFASWGWMQPPPDANPALANNGVFIACRIAHDDWANDVGRGLKRIERLVKDYRCLGVPASEIHICAVFDAAASYWMLDDEAYGSYTGQQDRNPNRRIIEELVSMGVDLELSAEAMKEHGWTDTDVLPGVNIVTGAMVRLADLGRRGYDYLPF